MVKSNPPISARTWGVGFGLSARSAGRLEMAKSNTTISARTWGVGFGSSECGRNAMGCLGFRVKD